METRRRPVIACEYLYRTASDKVAQAIHCEKRQRYAQALQLYRQGCGYFIAGLRKDRYNTRRKQFVLERVNGFVSRAETLHEALQLQQRGKRASAAASRTDSHASAVDPQTQAISARVAAMFRGGQEESEALWDQIAGMRTAKEALQEAVVLPQRFPEAFHGARAGWNGVMLFGPPGTGKTLIAKAVAQKAECHLVSVSAADIGSKYQGESARVVREIFQQARRQHALTGKPTIIFLDEVDSIGRRRSEGEKPSTRQIKTELLRQMDGVDTKGERDGVIVLAATNTPWELDSALRRRFQKRILVPLPDVKCRERILRVHMGAEHTTMTEAQYAAIAKKIDGYSGSDIGVVVREALMMPVREAMMATHFRLVEVNGASKATPCDPGCRVAMKASMMELKPNAVHLRPVTMADFEAAVRCTRATVSDREAHLHLAFANQFGTVAAPPASRRQDRARLAELAKDEPSPGAALLLRRVGSKLKGLAGRLFGKARAADASAPSASRQPVPLSS